MVNRYIDHPLLCFVYWFFVSFRFSFDFYFTSFALCRPSIKASGVRACVVHNFFSIFLLGARKSIYMSHD